eukprot:ANDGO_07041.mRNA.1 Cleavage and polyadenylation specificity factor subunit 4
MALFFSDANLKFQFERHLQQDVPPDMSKRVVCKYWLFGRCKLGEECHRLHVYDRSKMAPCQFFQDTGECLRPDCEFLHIRKGTEIKECPWYNRGFCKHGSRCRHKHERREACPNYFAGFCAKGRTCEYAHPNFDCAWIMRETNQEMQREKELQYELQRQYQIQQREQYEKAASQLLDS